VSDASVGGVVKALFPINCAYNYKEDADGQCRVKTCMLVQGLMRDALIVAFEQKKNILREFDKKGCNLFKKDCACVEAIKRKNSKETK